MNDEQFDVVIVGGGPGGLSAALALGRGRRRVLLCDAGPRRNAAAEEMHNFLTRDGTPPSELRRLAREELSAYPSVKVVDARVESVSGEDGAFDVRLGGGQQVRAKKVLLTTGMIDLPSALPGLREVWGHSSFQCPYCHGWEHRDQHWGYLASAPELLLFPMLLRGWTKDVTLLTDGRVDLPAEVRAQLESGGVHIDERRIESLAHEGTRLRGVTFTEGATLPMDVLFHHPPQKQVPLVESLGVKLNDGGYVQVEGQGKTSRAGIWAAGDLTTHVQGAVLAASAGMLAAAGINFELALG
ncbi:MAG: NAD(P)/FAD-dependent oxidoreductase [Archangium sp.]